MPIVLVKQDNNCCASFFRADTTQGLAPFQVAFIDSTVPIPVSWLWDFGDGTTSTDQFPVHVYTEPGIYTVTLVTTGSTGCTDTVIQADYIIVDVATGAAPMFNPSAVMLEVSPNPFSTTTTAMLSLPQPLPVRLTLTDLAGRQRAVVAEGTMPAGKNPFVIGSEGLPSGSYLLRAEVAGSRFVRKLTRW
ncbi:MAG: PKD domain-containing protein [Chitinophagales bacterium]|nr:PKD domain-containing protein [Chitinophagales bacterium]